MSMLPLCDLFSQDSLIYHSQKSQYVNLCKTHSSEACDPFPLLYIVKNINGVPNVHINDVIASITTGVESIW